MIKYYLYMEKYILWNYMLKVILDVKLNKDKYDIDVFFLDKVKVGI